MPNGAFVFVDAEHTQLLLFLHTNEMKTEKEKEKNTERSIRRVMQVVRFV